MTEKVTLRDVANLAGVSTATVSRVINQRGAVSMVTRSQVMKAMEDLQFKLPARSRQVSGSRTKTIAVVLNHLDWPVIPSWMNELHRVITTYGYNTIVAASEGGAATRRHCVNLIAREQVDGAIFYSPHGDTYAEIAHRLGIENAFRHERGLFCIDVSRRRGFHVLTDEHQIGRIAASHLIGAGARDIAMIGGPSNLPAAQTREEGFMQSMVELGYDRAHIPVEPAESWGFDSGYSAMELLLAQTNRLDGLFVSSDHAAIGALRLLHERQVDVQGSMAIVSVDNMPQSAYCIPALSTIDTQIATRAELAVSELVHLIDEDSAEMHDVTIGVRLVVRESSRLLKAD